MRRRSRGSWMWAKCSSRSGQAGPARRWFRPGGDGGHHIRLQIRGPRQIGPEVRCHPLSYDFMALGHVAAALTLASLPETLSTTGCPGVRAEITPVEPDLGHASEGDAMRLSFIFTPVVAGDGTSAASSRPCGEPWRAAMHLMVRGHRWRRVRGQRRLSSGPRRRPGDGHRHVPARARHHGGRWDCLPVGHRRGRSRVLPPEYRSRPLLRRPGARTGGDRRARSRLPSGRRHGGVGQRGGPAAPRAPGARAAVGGAGDGRGQPAHPTRDAGAVPPAARRPWRGACRRWGASGRPPPSRGAAARGAAPWRGRARREPR